MDVRPSLAGVWYPSDPEQLKETMEELFRESPDPRELPDLVYGLLVPHAGLRYSGKVAAAGYAALAEQRPEAIVLIAPLHSYHRSPVLTTAYEAYATPMGTVPIDLSRRNELSNALHDRLGVGLVAYRDDSEHSIEVQLPFLQRVFEEFTFVPILLARQTSEIVRCLAEALEGTLPKGSSLVVASSDLSHYFSQQEAKLLDHELLSRVLRFDAEGVLRAQDEGAGYACGHGAIAAALLWAAAAGAKEVRLLRYSTSAEATGDTRSVVGYAAACMQSDGSSASAGLEGR